jgi:hypothetical protein
MISASSPSSSGYNAFLFCFGLSSCRSFVMSCGYIHILHGVSGSNLMSIFYLRFWRAHSDMLLVRPPYSFSSLSRPMWHGG